MQVGVGTRHGLKGLKQVNQGSTQRGLGYEGLSRARGLGPLVVDTQGGPTAPLGPGVGKGGKSGLNYSIACVVPLLPLLEPY